MSFHRGSPTRLDHHALSIIESVDAASILAQLRVASAPSQRIDVIINSSVIS